MSPLGIIKKSTQTTPSPTTNKLWLLLVGVNSYQDTQLPSLHYAAVDCQGLATALKAATQTITEIEILIHHDFVDSKPNLENVRASLKKIADTAKSQDTVLFYFSGHGMLEPNSHTAFLCLENTQKNNLKNTGLQLQELLQVLGNCPARQQLVWLDACHSGGMTLRGVTPQLVEVLQQRAAQSKGFYALLSCDINQQSWEFTELEHGVFTYFLMQGLHGEAADSQGVISADSLYRYVYHQTLQYIDKTNQQLRLINQQKRGKGETQLYSEYPLQTPKRIVEGVGELIIGRTTQSVVNKHHRVALVVEGLNSSTTTLEISKLLGGVGGFELEYLQAGKTSAEELRQAISKCLTKLASSSLEPATVLLYLRGYIDETHDWDGLVLGEDIRIKRSWLKQQLRNCNAKQIIILDCPQSHLGRGKIQDWVEDLQIDSRLGQCVIGGAALHQEPERFTQTWRDILMTGALPAGLSAAGAIAHLQIALADSGIPVPVWLSGAQGIIEIIPAHTHPHPNTALDLGICPYMGLNAFNEQDSQYFYGRDSLTQQLLHHVAHHPFLAVVGASGSGKSSLVQAGLIPQLRQGKTITNSDQWLIKTIRPGLNPLQALAQKFAPSSVHILEGILHQGVEGFVYWLRSQPQPLVVLVIDQFEELFTLTPTPDRERFLTLVLGAVQYASDRFKLIITLRADFIAPCLEIPTVALQLQQSSVLVPPKLSLDDYRRVILQPAQQVGLKVESELVEVLLRELNNSAGDLPLLEFVLEQLWQHRKAGELTLQAYQQQLGGLKGALQRSCQAVFESLDTSAQDCAKWVFLSLTQLGEGTEDTRRRVNKAELIVKKYPQELVERTLQALTAAKLVVMNLEEEELQIIGGKGGVEKNVETLNLTSLQQPVTVEVAHEILIRHWSTLRWWLEENRERLRKQRQIAQAAQLWLQSNKEADFLLQGVRLAEAEDIYIKYTDELSQEVQIFIEACLEQRQQQQRELKKRLRQAQITATAMSLLGTVAIGMGGVAYWQSQTAQVREIEALNSSSQANSLSNQQLEALIASVKAGRQVKHTLAVPTNVQIRTASVLGKSLANIQESNRLEGHEAAVASVTFSPDGKTIASASDDKTIKIWRRDGKLIRTLKGHKAEVRSVIFSPDGETIATASFDQTVKLWRTHDGALLKTLNGHTAEVLSVAWSPQGNLVATASADDTVRLWQVSADRLLNMSGHNADVNSVSFSQDGKILASASSDRTVKLWQVSNGKLLKTLTGHNEAVFSVAISPDGKTLTSASADKTIKLWKFSNGSLSKTITAHNADVRSLNFSPDSKTLISGSTDSTIKLWNPQDGSLLETFQGHSIGVYSVNFSPDGQIIVSAGADKTVRLWQRSNTLLQNLQGHQGRVYSVSFSPKGNLLATASEDTSLKIWRTDGTLVRTLEGLKKSIYGHSAPVYGVTFSPDGETIASASSEHFIKLWRAKDGYMIRTLQGHENEVNSVSFSPDSKLLASASADTTVKLWRVKEQKLLTTLQGHKSEVLSVAFSPQGDIIASASRDNKVIIWRVSDGKLLQTITGHTNPVNGVSFSPQGDILATASSDNKIKLWRVQDGALLHTLEGHTNAVWNLTFSPNGKYIASAIGDGKVKLWSRDGRELKTYSGHGDAVLNVSFSPDSKMLASASFDGTAKLWKLDTAKLPTADIDNLLVNSCSWLHDYLQNNPQINDQESRDLCPENNR